MKSSTRRHLTNGHQMDLSFCTALGVHDKFIMLMVREVLVMKSLHFEIIYFLMSDVSINLLQAFVGTVER